MSFEGNHIPPPFPTVTSSYLSDDDKKERFVGEKYEAYYKEKFELITAIKHTSGFNIGAFFLGPIWLFYRKMYVYGAIYIAFVMVSEMLTSIFELHQSIDRAISIALAVIMGLAGNTLYKYFVEKRIKIITENHASNVAEVLAEKGGTSAIAGWGLFILYVILVYLSL